ncbi:hypothetical protein HanIR_Chr16g0791331 [Helianthus annuus]|nr:hypothetical protein HanIR_Chr16g0791331 [Helianthus annuus]
MAEHPDDLDQLLDSALDDFQTLNLASSSQRFVLFLIKIQITHMHTHCCWFIMSGSEFEYVFINVVVFLGHCSFFWTNS